MPSKNNRSLSNKSDNFFDINENTNIQKSSSLKYVRIFIMIIVIALNIFILNWLLKVHKCKCANIKEALYLKEWYMFLITTNIISFIIIIFDISINNLNLIYFIAFISLILTIVSFVMIIRLLIYISKLKKNNCDCGMTTQENIIYYWYIVIFSILLFIILLTILGALSTLFLYK